MTDERCITCGDYAVRMRVAGFDAAGLARCAGEGGAEELVDATLVMPVEPGDLVLVHAGVALTRLEEDA